MAAVPAACLLAVVGAVSLGEVRDEAVRLAPILAFLAAVLVLAQLCDDDGLFRAVGSLMARTCAGRPRRLLLEVFGVASIVTAVFSLDATVVLLTPIVFATAGRLGTRPKPHVYACTHLANSASLLLPVSNLTNLLAFPATGLTFTRFAGLMTVPWLAAIATEYVIFRRFFATDLDAGAESLHPDEPVQMPVFALGVVILTLAGFVVTSLFGVPPYWAAMVGATMLGIRALARGHTSPRRIWLSASVPFLAFVLALSIVVEAVVDNGLGAALRVVIPGQSSLLALLAIAALAAVLANLINNLPAVLALLPVAAENGTATVLAVLLGVNIGPNLTYAGSLATLLWRRVLRLHQAEPDIGEFTRLGLLSVPAALVLSVVALWAGLHTIGA